MSRSRWSAVVAASAITLALAASPAQAAGSPGLLPASARIGGLTGSQLVGAEFRQVFALPTDQNPFAGAGPSCFTASGRGRDVLILWTRHATEAPATCTVPPGTPVFASTFFGDCSSVEPPPFHGDTPGEQRRCVEDYLAGQSAVAAVQVSVDGSPPVDIRSPRYEAVSCQQRITLPADNIFGVAPGPMTFVSATWAVMLRPLPVGSHTIRVTVEFSGGATDTSEGTIVVTPAAA